MKSVLISIKPKWCELIASGEKIVEVRKTKPKLETPFKVYIYCTKDEPLYESGEKFWCKKAGDFGNGKVIGEFVCDCITPLYNVCYDEWERLLGGLHRIEKELVGQACLTEKELHSYANGKRCYAWHISDLVIYDKPKELSEFYRECKYEKDCGSCPHLCVENTPNCYETWCEVDGKIPITRPPQSWCYVERKEDGK